MLIVKLILFSLAVVSAALAQDSRGQIQGRVTDPSGAVISGANVRAVNTATNVATNQTGDFLIPFLLPGTYKVSVEAPGFKQRTRDGVGVQVNDRITLNAALTVGSATEAVSVTGDAPLVDASSASLGTVVDQRRVSELPLKDGNPIMLSSLSLGVMNLSTGHHRQPPSKPPPALNTPAPLSPKSPPADFKVTGGLTFAGANGEPRGLWSARSQQSFSPHWLCLPT